MPEPTICVALDSTNLDDMVDEAAAHRQRVPTSLKFDLTDSTSTKPDPVMVEQEEGEPKSVMPRG